MNLFIACIHYIFHCINMKYQSITKVNTGVSLQHEPKIVRINNNKDGRKWDKCKDTFL